jgi:copper chaperone CopZ
MKKAYIVGILAVSIVAFLFFSFGEEAENVYADSDTVIFTGIDTSCLDCEEKLGSALQNILGIDKYTINKNEDSIEVVYDPSQMRPEWISKSLEASGIQIEDIKRE